MRMRLFASELILVVTKQLIDSYGPSEHQKRQSIDCHQSIFSNAIVYILRLFNDQPIHPFAGCLFGWLNR